MSFHIYFVRFEKCWFVHKRKHFSREKLCHQLCFAMVWCYIEQLHARVCTCWCFFPMKNQLFSCEILLQINPKRECGVREKMHFPCSSSRETRVIKMLIRFIAFHFWLSSVWGADKIKSSEHKSFSRHFIYFLPNIESD